LRFALLQVISVLEFLLCAAKWVSN